MDTHPDTPAAFNARILADQDLLFTLASALLGDDRCAEAAVQQACAAAYARHNRPGALPIRELLIACLVETCLRAARPRWLSLWPRPTPPQDCLRTLPVAHRAAVALVDLGGFTYAEAARILGCTSAEVCHTLAAARQILSQQITA
jgi:DNA-directed RNA polymerase specialized sigma24 family protein